MCSHFEAIIKQSGLFFYDIDTDMDDSNILKVLQFINGYVVKFGRDKATVRYLTH
jgi:hypothetical protein